MRFEPRGLGFVGEEVVVGAADAGGEEFDEEAIGMGGGDGDLFPNLRRVLVISMVTVCVLWFHWAIKSISNV